MGRLGTAERRAFDGVTALCSKELPVLELLDRSSAELARRLPADAYCSSQLDPATGLLLNSVSEGWPDAAKPMLIEHVFLRTLAASPYELFRRGHRAVTVDALLAGEDDLLADPYLEHHLVPFGYRYEVQCLCAAAGAPQAILTFSRVSSGGDFGPAALRLLAAIAPRLGRAVRDARIRESLAADQGRGVGVLLMNEDGSIATANRVAEQWLEASGFAGSDKGWQIALPMFLRLAATTEARMTEALPAAWELVNPATGALYRVTAERSRTDTDDRRLMITMEPIRLADSPALLRRVGLTERETEVATELLRGASHGEIAHRLGCSRHTVGDHARSIFSKLDVQSRAELAGVLLGLAGGG